MVVGLLLLAAEYPLLMGLLRQRTHKELATRIVHTVLDTNTRITSVDKAAMLFRWVQIHAPSAPCTLHPPVRCEWPRVTELALTFASECMGAGSFSPWCTTAQWRAPRPTAPLPASCPSTTWMTR